MVVSWFPATIDGDGGDGAQTSINNPAAYYAGLGGGSGGGGAIRRFRYSNNKVQISIIMTSKIKVDNIENQCGGAVVTKCGATTTISGSVVKADDIQAADGGNLINQCGTTITLGASGDTINLASGASQTGFGRTGTVDWDTTAKTASFTAVNGNGYFVNTTSGAITVNYQQVLQVTLFLLLITQQLGKQII
jgi:hypothetical protein